MRINKNAKVSVHPLTAAAVALGVALAAFSFVGSDAKATDGQTFGGTAAVYGNIAPDQIESLSTGDRIKSVAAGRTPTAIWQTLEHGEKVECFDCIPSVGELLYDPNPKTREIAAWWLRRRIFGVFGPGEVYDQTLATLKSDPDPIRRSYAANALGEFLAFPGIEALSNASQSDADARVRSAAIYGLGRMGSDGNGAVGRAMGDADTGVKLAAVRIASRINGFRDVANTVKLANDADVHVRRNAAELLGTWRAKEGFDGLAQMANDADPDVRNAAAHSLGALHDQRAVPILTNLSTNDPSTLVRDQAAIALRRL
jgi:HEAT repeat protein